MEMKITHLGYNIVYIDTETKLKECVQELNACSVIGFDLEFDNNYFKYGFNICLIQIATEKTCFIIDPIALKTKQLKPVFEVFENPKIVKVAHSSGEDLRLLQSLGCHLQNLFDTDIAVKILNYEKISLGNIVQAKFDVTLDKSLQVSNWHLRPLSSQQLVYAANDVLFLLRLKNMLSHDMLGEKQKWFNQEMATITSVVFENEVKEDFLSKADRKDLGDFDQYVMNELLKYRDSLAKKLQRASHRVISAEPFRELIKNPEKVDNWVNMKGFYHALKTTEVQNQVKSVLEKAIAEAQQRNLPKVKTYTRLSQSDYEEELKIRFERQRIKDEVFKPIQNKLANLYGEFTATHIMSNVLVNDIVVGKIKISDMKLNYKQQIINSIAHELGFDLGKYV